MDKIIQSRKASAVPGDDLREMTKAHVDVTGERWPAGTEFRPLSHGRDNTIDMDVQTISIVGTGRSAKFARLADMLDRYARETVADMSHDTTVRGNRLAAAVRAMRDEPGEVARAIGCTAEEVVEWCEAQ